MSTATYPLLLKVTKPMYQSLMHHEERGYQIEFSLNNPEIKPVSVVFNKIKQNITQNHRQGNRYTVRILSQSGVIDNFQPEFVDLPNGIIFRINDTLYLKKIDFQPVNP
ncbi:MAG: hypothetical protein Q4G27_04235 [Flavobacteriaceae bacterium]|nr:hypothetical protein [Flavobacteriaceae bacterium]